MQILFVRKLVALGAVAGLVSSACGNSGSVVDKGTALVARGAFFNDKNVVYSYLWRDNAINIFNGLTLRNESTTTLIVESITLKSVDRSLELVGYRIVRAANLDSGTSFTGICAKSFPPPSPLSEPVEQVRVTPGETIAPIVGVRNPQLVAKAKMEGLRVTYKQGPKRFAQDFNFRTEYLEEQGRCGRK